MTSNQVTNLFGMQNANWTSSVQPAAKTESVDFRSFMKNSQDNLKSVEVKVSEVKKTAEENTKTESKEPVKQTEQSVKKDNKALDERKPSNDEIDTVKETVNKIADEVKEALGIDDEQLSKALEELGMNVMSLLIPENITAVAVEATGEESTISLVTNEALYENVKDLTQTVENLTKEMFEELDINPEDFTKAINEKSMEPKVPELNKKAFDELETKINIENEAPEVKELKNFSYQAGNESSSNDNIGNESKEETTEELNEDVKISDTPSSFVENLVDKTMEALSETSETQNYTAEETKQLMNQITENIKVRVNLDTTEISIKLHPESLGNVNVKVSANNEGTMTAQFTAENESVKAVIESQAAALKETLAAKGITVEAVEVMIGSHGFNEDLSNRQENGGNQEGSRKSSTRRINLNDLNEQEELTEEENLQKEIMQQNGNTIDYTA